MDYTEEYLDMGIKILICESLLERSIPDDMMFLDNRIIDKKTFETVRWATDEEIESFYNIRILRLRMREWVKNGCHLKKK